MALGCACILNASFLETNVVHVDVSVWRDSRSYWRGRESINCSEPLKSQGLLLVPQLRVRRWCGEAQVCPSEVGLLEL